MSNSAYDENSVEANIPFKKPRQTPEPVSTIRTWRFESLFSILLLVLMGSLATHRVDAAEIKATKSCKSVDCPSNVTGGTTFTLFKNQTIIWDASYDAFTECPESGICRITKAFYLSTDNASGTDIPLTTTGEQHGTKDLPGSMAGIKYFIGINGPNMGPGTYTIRFDLTPPSISVSPTPVTFDPVKKGEMSKDAKTFTVSARGDVDVMETGIHPTATSLSCQIRK